MKTRNDGRNKKVNEDWKWYKKYQSMSARNVSSIIISNNSSLQRETQLHNSVIKAGENCFVNILQYNIKTDRVKDNSLR